MTNVTAYKAQTITSAADLAANQTSQLAGKVAGAKGVTMERIDKVSKDFEAQFIGEMMENMFSTIDKKGDDVNGSDAEETYQSLLSQEYGKVLSRSGGIGVAAQIKQSMLRMQEIDDMNKKGTSNATVPTPAS